MIGRFGRSLRPYLEHNRGPRWTAGFIALATLGIMLVLWWQVGEWYQRQLVADRRSEAALEVSLRGNVLSSILNRRFARLQGLYAFAQSQPDLETLDTNFEAFASALYQDSTGIKNMAIAPGGVMHNIYPIEGNESVFGYVPLDDPRPEVRADTLRAIETGQIIVSGPVDLLQGGTGIILRQAVYKEGAFWGLVNLAIDLPLLLTEAGVNATDGNLDFALRDGRGGIIFGSSRLFEADPVLNTIDLPEGIWELAAVPPDGWQATVQNTFLVFQASGLVIVFLLMSLIYLSVNRQSRLALAVQERTSELSMLNQQLVQSHQSLEQRVQERTHALSSLLEISYNLAENLELQSLLQVLLDQLELFIGYDGAVIFLMEEGQLVSAASRGAVPEILEGELQSETRSILYNYWEKTGWVGPIRSNFNNPFTPEEGANSLGGHESGPAWISIPLKLYDQFIGMIILSQADPDYYTARHEQLVMVVANQAAVTIENARLYQQARNLAVLQERQRLARELHDSVSQALYGIALGARTAHTLLSQEPEKAAEPLEYVLTLSDAALTEMRALIFELRPESLEKEGLLAALERQADVLRSRFGLTVETKWEEEPPLSLPLKEALFRVAQEATNNIAKHAAAGRVTIQLLQNGRQIALEIRDDGQGFNPNEAFPGHLGLRSMQERIEQVGGSFLIESKPGEGTCIRTVIPVG